MGARVSRLFSEADLDRITSAVKAAEAKTSGEIAVVIVPHSRFWFSDHWAQAALWGVIASAGFLFLSRYDDWGMVYRYAQATIAGLAFFGLALAIFYFWASRPGQVSRSCWRNALNHFTQLGPTSAHTAVLILIAVREKHAVVIADHAIADKLPQEYWHKPQGMMAQALREGEAALGIVTAIAEIGSRLAQFFPRAADDVNELPDRPQID